MGKKKNKLPKEFRAKWQRTLNEKYDEEIKLQRFDDKLAELVKAEEERLMATLEFPFAVGDRIRRKKGDAWGTDFIERPGTVTGHGVEILTSDDDYYNPGYVMSPTLSIFINVRWDPTPRQKERNRKGSESSYSPKQLRLE